MSVTLLLCSNGQDMLLSPDNLLQVEALTVGGLDDSLGSVFHQRHSLSGKGTHMTKAIIFFTKILKNL